MNVGILTFHRGPNYGGFLQAWHLRQAVRSFGHDAEIVNYQGARHHESEQPGFRGWSVRAMKEMAHLYLKSRPFTRPVGELSRGPLMTEARQVPWGDYDAIVVGSDIVWDYRNPKSGSDPAFFGALPEQAGTRFVAYAPSCGETPGCVEPPDYVREGLRRFEACMVRDRNTADLVRGITGTEPSLVVDPTWLQSDPEGGISGRSRRPFLLVYGHGVKPGRARELKSYCSMRGLELVSVAFPCATADRRIRSIGPFEWANLFARADAVVTSTFHGLLYAIKYHKPVVFMERGPSRLKARIAIERCGLEDRVVAEGEEFGGDFLNRALDPDRRPRIPDEWVVESRQLLRQGLEEN